VEEVAESMDGEDVEDYLEEEVEAFSLDMLES